MPLIRSLGVALAAGTLLLAVACATTQLRWDAARLESAGRTEAAWRLMRDAAAARPHDDSLAREARRLGIKLSREILAEEESLAAEDLPSRLTLLRDAHEAYPESSSIRDRIESVRAEIAQVEARARRQSTADVLARLAQAWSLRGYAPYLATVRQHQHAVGLELATNRGALSSALAHAGREEALLLLTRVALLWPEATWTRHEIRVRLRERCQELVGLAARYDALPGGLRTATAAWFTLAAARFCPFEADLRDALPDLLGRVLARYRPTVQVAGNLTRTRREEVVRQLADLAGSGGFRVLPSDLVPSPSHPGTTLDLRVADVAVQTDRSVETRYSKYLSGEETLANPVYTRRLLEYQSALDALQSARDRPAPDAGSEETRREALEVARRAVEQAQEVLERTPPLLRNPIYVDYQHDLVSVEIQPVVSLAYAIWDERERLELATDRIRSVERFGFVIPADVHPQDVDPPAGDDPADADPKAILAWHRDQVFAQVLAQIAEELKRLNGARARNAQSQGWLDAARDYFVAQDLLTASLSGNDFRALLARLDEASVEEHLPGLAQLELRRAAGELQLESQLRALLREETRQQPAFQRWAADVFVFEPREAVIAARPGRRPLTPAELREDGPGAAPRGPPLSLADVVRAARESVVVIETPEGRGSGFGVRPDGFVLTSAHVVGENPEVSVALSDGTRLMGEVVEVSISKDLALVKLGAEGLPAIPMGTVEGLVIGETVVAIGAPLGLAQTATSGIVSAVRLGSSSSNEEMEVTYVQTDAAINEGNSGGPLLNLWGEAVAVNTLGLVALDFEGLNFSVAIDAAREAFPDYLAP